MSDEMWVIRAGNRARHAEEFLAGSYVAISFEDFAADDLSSTDDPRLKARASTTAEASQARQLSSFAYKVDVGDLVVMPRLTSVHRDYLVARVTGGYEHIPDAPASGSHRRSVQWLGRFPYGVISDAAANTLGAMQTVYKPSAVEAEIRGFLTALVPISDSPEHEAGTLAQPVPAASASAPAPAPQVEHTVAVKPPMPLGPVSVAQLDLDVDDRGRARMTCLHPALVMEQTPRHVDPARDWAGVPGIYVLTGTVLQQSSSRTGHERTLTMTSIIRPWAYVGLSEDFLGRLSSHRQSKPEWRRALLVRSGGQPFSSDDIKYLEHRVHAVLADTEEVALDQAVPRGNKSAQPRNTSLLDACADTVVAVLRLTGTLI